MAKKRSSGKNSGKAMPTRAVGPKVSLNVPFSKRNPKTDLIILVAAVAMLALVIMFLKFPR